MQNSNRPMQKLILAAMFAALSCVATMMIQIPAPPDMSIWVMPL